MACRISFKSYLIVRVELIVIHHLYIGPSTSNQGLNLEVLLISTELHWRSTVGSEDIAIHGYRYI